MKTLNAMRALAAAALAATCATGAAAQDEEYFNNSWWNCELSGRQTVWHIKSYRSGISFINETAKASGDITFSDDCIEINYPGFQMHFPVGSYTRISDDIFSVSRNGDDDYFDYIEVIRSGRGSRTTFRFMIAKREGDDTMQNTRIFTCRPQILQSGRDLRSAMETKASTDGIPPQVPRE